MSSLRVEIHCTPVRTPDVPHTTDEAERRTQGVAGGQEGLPGAIVIDVLRATTTLTQAFAAGAAAAEFVDEVGRAERLVRARPERRYLLCGERDGLPIPGFDLGNSPFEYTAERVAGRTLLFVSTNGSRAFLEASAYRTWAVSFVNLRAAVEAVAAWERTVRGNARRLAVFCAGKLGARAEEDSLCAATFLERLRRRLESGGVALEGSGDELPEPGRTPETTREAVRESEHGRYLRSLGKPFERDVDRCAEWDRFAIVPTGLSARLRLPTSPAPRP